MSIRRLTRPADTPPPSSGDFTIILVGGNPALRDRDGNTYLLGGGVAENITGLIQAGANVTLTGNGTLVSPYVVSASGGGGGTVTSVAITGTGLTVTGSPITESGTITLAVQYGTTAGTACQGNDSRLSDARTPTAHTHGNISNTGTIGSTEGLPIITGTGGVLQAGSFGTTAGTFCQGNDARLSDARPHASASPLTLQSTADPSFSATITSDNDGSQESNPSILTPIASGRIALTTRADGKTVPHELAPLAIVTEADSFTLSQSNHGGRWARLTKSSGTTTITLPTSGIDTGCAFQFFRSGAGALAFTGATVNGAARLADVVQNSAFGLVYLGSGTYDFI